MFLWQLTLVSANQASRNSGQNMFGKSSHEARKSWVNAREQNTLAVEFLIAEKKCCTRPLTNYLVRYCAKTTPGFMT